MARGKAAQDAGVSASVDERLGHIQGVVEGIATAQAAMRTDMATHMDKEERTLADYDKRMRRVETKVHTTWIIGGGALGAAGAYISHLLGWGK